jgi:hypothetical protein
MGSGYGMMGGVGTRGIKGSGDERHAIGMNRLMSTLFWKLCVSHTDHGPDRGSPFADRRPFRRSGPVQNRSRPAGPRFSDRTAATLDPRLGSSMVRALGIYFWAVGGPGF